jgi:hypothetical protein
MENKRENQRVRYEAEARIVADGKSSLGPIKDLSLKGIFIFTDMELETRSEVTVELHLAGSTTDISFRINGIVEWKTDQGAGIKFKEMELDSYIHLKNIVSYAESAMLDIKE